MNCESGLAKKLKCAHGKWIAFKEKKKTMGWDLRDTVKVFNNENKTTVWELFSPKESPSMWAILR